MWRGSGSGGRGMGLVRDDGARPIHGQLSQRQRTPSRSSAAVLACRAAQHMSKGHHGTSVDRAPCYSGNTGSCDDAVTSDAVFLQDSRPLISIDCHDSCLPARLPSDTWHAARNATRGMRHAMRHVACGTQCGTCHATHSIGMRRRRNTRQGGPHGGHAWMVHDALPALTVYRRAP